MITASDYKSMLVGIFSVSFTGFVRTLNAWEIINIYWKFGIN